MITCVLFNGQPPVVRHVFCELSRAIKCPDMGRRSCRDRVRGFTLESLAEPKLLGYVTTKKSDRCNSVMLWSRQHSIIVIVFYNYIGLDDY
jgi:hypothetical protein